MPLPADVLLDAQSRRMRYLRLSVTDRCNFRCTYCSPASWGGTKDLLTAPEFIRVTRVFAGLGIRRVRLTGGEPLLRPDILALVGGVAQTEGIERVALTTNASRLSALAGPLHAAGLQELNLSLDTLSPLTFRALSKQGDFQAILEGMDAAAAQGFASLKLNVVVMRGVNEHEALALIAFAHARHITPRFIELMPFGQGAPVPTAELVASLQAQGLSLSPLEPGPHAALEGPARYFQAPSGRVGFISPMTQNFCGSCNRVRVASNGDLRSCLGGRHQAPLHALIRAGARDEDLARAIRAALGEKPEGHRFNDAEARRALLPMMGIGG